MFNVNPDHVLNLIHRATGLELGEDEIVHWYNTNQHRYKLVKLYQSSATGTIDGKKVSGGEFNSQVDLNNAINAASEFVIQNRPQDTGGDDGYW
mgnify:CR=1 FL=1